MIKSQPVLFLTIALASILAVLIMLFPRPERGDVQDSAAVVVSVSGQAHSSGAESGRPAEEALEPERLASRIPALKESYAGQPMLLGQVLNESGSPIAGARVFSSVALGTNAETDEHGEFSFDDGQGWGLRRVIVSADEMVDSAVDCVAGRFSTIKLRHGVGVTLRVVERNERGLLDPLPNCPSLITDSKLEGLPSNAIRSKPDGTISVRALPESILTVRVLRPGQLPWTEQIVVSAILDGVHDVVVPAQPTQMVVEVRSADDNTVISHAHVLCDGMAIGSTDESGRLLVFASLGRAYEIRVGHHGYCDQVSFVRIGSGVMDIDVVVLLTRQAQLSGIVRSVGGAVVSGAHVTVRLQSKLRAISAPGVEDVLKDSAVISDVNGHFALMGIGSRYGTTLLRVRVSAEGYADYESPLLEVANGDQAHSIICTLERGLLIRGRVTSRDNGVRATVYLEGATRGVATDDEGGYELRGVPDSVHTVCAFVDEHRAVSNCVAVSEATDGVAIANIKCDYDMRSVTGTVTDDNHIPIVNAEVCVKFKTLDPEFPAMYKSRTDLSGKYALAVPVFEGEVEMTCDVGLRRWADDCQVSSVMPPVVVDLQCRASGAIRLIVIDQATGSAVALKKLDLLWLGLNEEPLVCMDRSDEGASGIVIVIPTGAGVLDVQYKDRSSRIKCTVVSGEVVDLGVTTL